jgi:hypothetical protein
MTSFRLEVELEVELSLSFEGLFHQETDPCTVRGCSRFSN